jgi:hypothetical protein
MPEVLDVWISREWGLSPEVVRGWPVDDVDRALAMLSAEAKATEWRQKRNA